MAEQQLVDYIKKAKGAGQTDDQTRNLLYKNGWTEAEVSDAFNSISQLQPQSQPQPRPEAIEPTKIEIRPQPAVQPQAQPQTVSQQPEPRYQPQQQPQPQYQPKENMPQMKTMSHWILKTLIVLIIVAVLGGAGYFVAGQYINLPWNPFPNFSFNFFASGPNPQTVINNMLTNMKSVKSSHTTTQIEISATDKNSKVSQGKLTLNTNSETDITDVNNPKTGGNFTINLTLPGSASPITATVSIAVVGSAFYFKINDITIPPANLTAGYSESDISQIKRKWLEIGNNGQDLIKAISQVEGVQAGTINASQTSNSDLIKKIQDLISAENMLSAAKQLNNETISGKDTYHYLITISKDKLKDLVNKIVALELQEASKLQDNSAINNSTTLTGNIAQAVVNTFVDAVGDINIEMWIGKTDSMLYQVKVDKTIDLSKITESSGATVGNNMQLEVKFNLTNSNFNKPITVQAPAGSQKIEDIVLPLLKAQKIQSDVNQIGFWADASFGISKSYSSLCNKGLLNGYLNTYGKELVDLNNDIVSQGAKKPVCFSGVQDYCVSTQLADGSWRCIDKSGKIGIGKCISYKTVCPALNNK